MIIQPTTRITRATKLAQRLFEERMLVITAKDSMLHRFNEVGTFIWQYLEEPRSVEEICRALEEHFDGFDGTTSAEEVVGFLEELLGKGLVKVAK